MNVMLLSSGNTHAEKDWLVWNQRPECTCMCCLDMWEDTGLSHSCLLTPLNLYTRTWDCLLDNEKNDHLWRSRLCCVFWEWLCIGCESLWRGAPALGSYMLPSSGLSPKLHIFPVLGALDLDTVLQIGPHEGRIEGHNHIPCPAGQPSSDGTQNTIGFLGCTHALLAPVKFFI